LTADDYENVATIKVSRADLRIGDPFFMFGQSSDPKHGTHVGTYVGVRDGKQRVIEARGERYGVVESTVDNILARGGVFRRYPWVPNLGDLTPAAVSLQAWMDRAIFVPRNSEMSGNMVASLETWYGIKPLWTLVVTGAETSCGRRSDGRIVQVAHNYGCITFGSRTTKWGELSLPNPLTIRGRKFCQYPDEWRGMMALGRLLKLGPSSNPGLYLRQLKVRDWHGFARTYYGAEVAGVEAYEANLLKIEAGFKKMAAAAGVTL
jgi:hypothetical protein